LQAKWEEAFATIHRLHALDFNQCGATLEEGARFPILRFTEEAQRVFDDWRSQLEHEIRSSEEHPALIAHFSKYRSLIPTLALLTHLAENGNGAVTLTALEKALKWDAYLRTHARRIYSLGENSPTDSAERLLNRIKKKQLNNPFTLREVYHKAWSGLNTPEAVRQAVEVLEAHSMVQQVKEPTTGRPKELIYINPDVLNA
jgi:putative DNA primase/helicase